MKLTSLLLILMGLTLATSQATQLYKWVDENGQTQFSQFPPSTSQQAQQIKVEAPKSNQSAASTEKLNTMRQKLIENSVDRGAQGEKDKEDAAKKEELAKACKTSKNRLRMLKENGRVYKDLENGEREWYDVKGREGLIKGAQEDITKYCS
jgi:Skp family chaperone for outer membrane proteins